MIEDIVNDYYGAMSNLEIGLNRSKNFELSQKENGKDKD
jgi:hypothetical protein